MQLSGKPGKGSGKKEQVDVLMGNNSLKQLAN